MYVATTGSTFDKATELRRLAGEHVQLLVQDLGLDANDPMVPTLSTKKPGLIFGRISRFQEDSPGLCRAVLSRFCARYLQNFVDSIVHKASSPLINYDGAQTEIGSAPSIGEQLYDGFFERMTAFPTLLRFCRPYMDKYMLVSTAGKRGRLIGACAVKFLMLGIQEAKRTLGESLAPVPIPSDAQASPVTQTLDHLQIVFAMSATILMYLPSETRTEIVVTHVVKDLIDVLRRLFAWTQAIPTMEKALMMLVGVLSGEVGLADLEVSYVDDVHGLERCGRRDCPKTPETAQMFQCSRCHVVIYCSKKHQVDDWQDSIRPHKAWCYKTQW